MISIFKKKKTTKTLNVKKINNNLQKYFAIDIFTIAPLNNYSSTTKEWDFLYDNFVSMNKENYFGIVAYYDNPGNNKIIFNGWDGLINFYILLKAFYDSLNKQQCEEYESFFRDFFIYTDYSKNKYYLKIQKNTYNDCLKKIINFNNLKINSNIYGFKSFKYMLREYYNENYEINDNELSMELPSARSRASNSFVINGFVK